MAQATSSCADEIASGRMGVRQAAVESFSREAGEAAFDVAFAIRVGALDGGDPLLELDVTA